MDTKTRIILVSMIATFLSLALVAGGWFAYTAYAQSTNRTQIDQGIGCHDNQAVLDLFKITESDLIAERQGGKSLLDIATAKGVNEQQLTDALLRTITVMHGWMSQSLIPEAQRRGNLPQANTEQMIQYMRDWIAKDIRETKYGTMTDLRLFGGNGAGMMGGGTGYGGMMSGVNGYGGMMGGGTGYGGMMRGGSTY